MVVWWSPGYIPYSSTLLVFLCFYLLIFSFFLLFISQSPELPSSHFIIFQPLGLCQILALMEEPINSLVPLAVQYENLVSLMRSNLVFFAENLPESLSSQSGRINEAIRPLLDQLQRCQEEIKFSNEHQSVSEIEVFQYLDHAGSLCTDKLRMAFYKLANGFVKLRAIHTNLENEFVLSWGLFQSSTCSADAGVIL